jgi:hypothetical protein
MLRALADAGRGNADCCLYACDFAGGGPALLCPLDGLSRLRVVPAARGPPLTDCIPGALEYMLCGLREGSRFSIVPGGATCDACRGTWLIGAREGWGAVLGWCDGA